ncbi:lipopolysaccharide kinase InaA family protein [Verrucomicrobiota bacterium]
MQEILANGIKWHVSDNHFEFTAKWLSAHFPIILKDNKCLLKEDKGSRVAVADGLVIKESTARKGRSVFRFGLRRSGAYRAFRMGNELADFGLNTPRPVAWATIRCLGLRIKEYLITEEIADSHLLTETLKSKNEEKEHAEIISKWGRLLAAFHVNGFSNRDMKDTNILVTRNEGLKLWAVDLDGVRRRKKLKKRRIERDFWPIVRSLRMYGWIDDSDMSALLAGYNELASENLRLSSLPSFPFV